MKVFIQILVATISMQNAIAKDVMREVASTRSAPEWSCSKDFSQISNSSYLANRKEGLTREQDAMEEIISHDRVLRKKQEFSDMTRNYDMRSNYNVVSKEEERQHLEQMNSFSKSVVSEVRDQQVKKNLRNLRQASEREENLRAIRRPVEFLAGLYAFYQGEPVKVKLADSKDTKVEASAVLPSKTASVGVSSPIVNGGVSHSISAQEANQKNVGIQDQPKAETTTVSLSRPLPWAMSSGISYGVATTTMTASLSKGIAGGLSSTVQSTRSLQPGNTGTVNQESVRLDYGVRF